MTFDNTETDNLFVFTMSNIPEIARGYPTIHSNGCPHIRVCLLVPDNSFFFSFPASFQLLVLFLDNMDTLFDYSWFPDKASGILTVFYFPFGIALVIIRLFLTLHALLVSCILPKSAASSLIMKTLFGVIGIHVVVQEDASKQLESKPKIIVTNHVSKLDHMVVDFIQPCVAPDEVGLSSFFRWMFGYRDFGKMKGTDVLEQNIKEYVKDAKIPVVFHPEQTTTNGTGLLKFRPFPFSLELSVLPVAIQATRWPLKAPVSTLQSSRISEFLWALFFPYTIYKIRILEPENKREEETVEAFSERVREKIAQSLNIVTTQFTMADKMDYLKKIIAEQARRKREASERASRSQNGSGFRVESTGMSLIRPSPEIEKMANQVKNVLPHIPISTIISDLEASQDVDITITNILEGKLKEVKSPEVKSSQHPVPVMSSSVCASQQKYGASSFSRSPADRQLSLSDRKRIMLETARQRYKEKHGLI